LSVLPLTAMNGFLLGYVVPTWHRNAEQRHRFSRGDDADDAVPTALLRFELRRQSGAPIAAQGVAPTPKARRPQLSLYSKAFRGEEPTPPLVGCVTSSCRHEAGSFPATNACTIGCTGLPPARHWVEMPKSS
jgi:hypothetical protein